MGEMSQKTLDLCEQIASMLFVKVPQKEIAEVFGWPQERVSNIVNNPQFQNYYQDFARNEVSRQYNVSNKWDRIEDKAQDIILETLTTVCDPDFALRAAAVSNRASRKGLTNSAEPLNIKGGARTTIILNVDYTKQINNNGNGTADEKVLEIEYTDVQDDADENTDVMPLNKLKEFMDQHSGQISAGEVTDAVVNAAMQAIK